MLDKRTGRPSGSLLTHFFTKYVSVAGIVLAALVGVRTSEAQDAPPVPPPVKNNNQLLQKYVWSTLGPEGAISATLLAGVDQWRVDPPEWGTGASGYAKRWASEFGTSAVTNTTKYAVARMFDHDPSFTRCECSGFRLRLRHVVTLPLTARRRDGRRVLSPAIVAGLVAGQALRSTWTPGPYSVGDGARNAAAGLAVKIAMNVFREFVYHRSKP